MKIFRATCLLLAVVFFGFAVACVILRLARRDPVASSQ